MIVVRHSVNGSPMMKSPCDKTHGCPARVSAPFPPVLRWTVFVATLLVAHVFVAHGHIATASADDASGRSKVAIDDAGFSRTVKPLLAKYCLACHSTQEKKGSLDLERFARLDDVRKHVQPWQSMIEQLETGEMPPKSHPQPTDEERQRLTEWVRSFLDAEARARTGDPGRLPLRRLSNFEYDTTIRDLTGVDLQPTREFPKDGAGGEGFTNASESLSDISPVLFARYLGAAKEIADHAVLLPDSFRFSASKTRRDWTDEATARLRKFYGAIAPPDGKLAIPPYLLATVRHREALKAGKFDEVATQEKLNVKYLRLLWETLASPTTARPTEASPAAVPVASAELSPLDAIRGKWRTATEKEVAELAVDVAGWQAALWRTARVGSYLRSSFGPAGDSGNSYTESLSRQAAFDHPAAESVTLRLPVKPAPGQSSVTVHLVARELGSSGPIAWLRPRFEGNGKPMLLLRDYAQYGPAYESNISSAFINTAAYLSAVVELTHGTDSTIELVAEKNRLHAAFLRQWVKVLAIAPRKTLDDSVPVGAALTLLDQKTTPSHGDAISGWSKSGTDLPVVVANSSDQTLQIPGRISAKSIAVHPTPQEFVAVVWKSPIAGNVTVASRVVHAHPSCGNGVAWHLEHRRGDKAKLLGESELDLGQEAKATAKSLAIEQGDLIVLAVDPRDANHACDLTEVALTITEDADSSQVWDLAKDVAWDIQAGNPHGDKRGNADVWSFARGPARKPSGNAANSVANTVPGNSTLGQWRTVAADPERRAEAAKMAEDVARVLTGPRPAKELDPDRLLYDRLVTAESPLFAGVDLTMVAERAVTTGSYGLPKERFIKATGSASGAANGATKPSAANNGAGSDGKNETPGEDLLAASDAVIAIQLPAALFAGREFVVDAKLGGDAARRLARVVAATQPPDANSRWDGPVLAAADSPAYKAMIASHDAFRQVFPLFLCFPEVVPRDEVVSLKMFHREDEPLERLFLSAEQSQELDRLWVEHRLISRQPVAEYDYLPQFMGYTTQDTPKALQQFFIDRKPRFKQEADEFLKFEESAIPGQLEALTRFAEKAYRRPLRDSERAELRTLYDAVRAKRASHDEAFRGVLARVLVSPAFLFRVETAPAGKEPGTINDWELATRLSYFLWSSLPDDELRSLAATGRLRDPQVLADQTRRMLKDPRTRALAMEFGTQWIHVRGFDELKEKNEQLFPQFDATLRQAMYEEAILFFQDLFQGDRPIASVLDADHTFLNEPLAKHYGIPGVSGPQWRRVDGVKKFGRGGVLGLASVQAKQSGASRTSPVLRGNWVVETLLGEKLPRPPANVPILPDQEGTDKLTTRQMVEQHVSNPSCASCHARIDPFGFAFENFDAIGRFRLKESNGQPVDTKARLRDGTEFTGIEGLRDYLLAKRKETIVRLFCQRLVGYALGRGTTLSDTTLINQMVAASKASEDRVSAAVLTIVGSPQFQMIRGRDVSVDE